LGPEKLSNAYSPELARAWDRVVAPGGELLGKRILRYFYGRRPDARGCKVLDLCCGTGRATRFLARNGHQVLGLDLSPSMISQARRHCRSFIRTGKVRFQVADVRNFDVGTGFDLAVAPWDGLNHLDDLDQMRACFRCVRRSLSPGGLFIFDLVTRESLIHDMITVERHHDWVAILEERYSTNTGSSLARFNGFVKKKNGDYERYDQTLSWTPFAIAAVQRALRATGFREVRLLDEETLERELCDPEDAARVFFAATRPCEGQGSRSTTALRSR
jgi:SAM-dependent methyltransferase